MRLPLDVYKRQALEDHETPLLRKRLIASVGFLLVLMYFSMGHMMWGWPLPAWFDGNHIAMGLVQLLLAGIVMVINQKFFISGFRSLWHRSPNMDNLVALGSMASFVWSVYALFAMTRAQVDGNSELVMHYMMEMCIRDRLTILGFTSTYGSWVSIFTAVAMCCFAFSTAVGWGLYGARCIEFLFSEKVIKPFMVIYSLVAILGATANLGLMWSIAETFNGLMAIPNLIALFLLSGTVVKLTKEYFAGEDVYKRQS